MTVTTRDSHCPKMHATTTQLYANECERAQPSPQHPSEWVSNVSMLATCSFFTKSVFALYLLYLDSSLSLCQLSIHMYLSTLRPSCFYLLHLDFWSLDPLVPNPDLVNTYSSIVSLSYCTWLAHLPCHRLTFASSYSNCRYSAVVL